LVFSWLVDDEDGPPGSQAVNLLCGLRFLLVFPSLFAFGFVFFSFFPELIYCTFATTANGEMRYANHSRVRRHFSRPFPYHLPTISPTFWGACI